MIWLDDRLIKSSSKAFDCKSVLEWHSHSIRGTDRSQSLLVSFSLTAVRAIYTLLEVTKLASAVIEIT